jgi:hypothetical protein
MRGERLVDTIRLPGDFDLDALSPDGRRIYPLERFHDGTARSYIRLYQVARQALLDTPIANKSKVNEQMSATAVARQTAADGSKVFTFYINPSDSDYPGTHCLDLPGGQEPDALSFYTLARHGLRPAPARP